MGEREVIIIEAEDKRGIWADKWLGGRWGVTIYFSLLCSLFVKHPTVQYRDGNSRVFRMDC